MQPTLTVHLDALAENYRRLKAQFSGEHVAAVVKADAYGLGAREVSKKLIQEKCPTLFVATLEEGILLKSQLEEDGITPPAIAVFHGPFKGEEETYIEHGLIPVINYISQLERWMLKSQPAEAPYMLHVDTGMTRLGLSEHDIEWLGEHGEKLLKRKPTHLLSHLACAEQKEHSKNKEQLKRFEDAKLLFPGVPTSFCNSSGMYLDRVFHGHLARPGSALYGINPATWMSENPMQHVADLTAPIITIREFTKAETIGYGATAELPASSRVAIVQMGYADGYLRYLSNKGQVFVGNTICPVVGRVSMDMVAVDVTHLGEQELHNKNTVDIICKLQPVDAVAKQANTIGYETFTSLSGRVKREYI